MAKCQFDDAFRLEKLSAIYILDVTLVIVITHLPTILTIFYLFYVNENHIYAFGLSDVKPQYFVFVIKE